MRRIYSYLDEQSCPTDKQAHDSSSSVGKYLTEERPETMRVLDTWYATITLAMGMNRLAAEPKQITVNHGTVN